ncbi:SDR family NAD(P)-dependent oxidoreductase, partial [Kibdelosporangium persicum]
MDLTGKVAVVTGGGRGLGAAYATALAGRGAAVVVNDADATAAHETAESIRAAGGRAVGEPGAV